MAEAGGPAALERFLQSMVMDRDRWLDGTGYDLAALAAAAPAERAAIGTALLRHQPRCWQDIEALAALDTPAARAAVLAALDDPDPQVRAAVTRFAAGLVGTEARTAALVRGLETAGIYAGLTQVLLQVEDYHPPAVMAALLHGARHREGEVAMHLAALVLYLHGAAAAPFDEEQRPFLLRFHTADPVARQAAFRELCARIGVAADPYLA